MSCTYVPNLQFVQEVVNHYYNQNQVSMMDHIYIYYAMVHTSPCVQAMIPFLPNTTHIIQWIILNMEWRDIFLPVWFQLLFSPLKMQVHHYVIENPLSAFFLLKFLLGTTINSLPSSIGNKIIDTLFIR